MLRPNHYQQRLWLRRRTSTGCVQVLLIYKICQSDSKYHRVKLSYNRNVKNKLVTTIYVDYYIYH